MINMHIDSAMDYLNHAAVKSHTTFQNILETVLEHPKRYPEYLRVAAQTYVAYGVTRRIIK